MNADRLRHLLIEVREGRRSLDEALTALKAWPYEDLGYARLDHHRTLRKGFPEVVFCEGKTPQQAAEIIARLAQVNERVMGTRASRDVYEAIRALSPQAHYYESARIVLVQGEPSPPSPPLPNQAEARYWEERGVGSEDENGYVVVASGGTADIPVAEEAAVTAEILGLIVKREYDVGVAGLHRLVDRLETLQAARVIIAVAGMDGVLPSVIAGLVACPVIAVPTSIGYGTGLGGIAALLTMLNACAPGIACVNIDNGFGAGVMAHLICHIPLRTGATSPR